MIRYGLHPHSDDPEQFRAEVKAICDLYQEAPALANVGVQVHSCDEMTGIAAREDTHPALPMVPGHVERKEFE